MARVKISAVAVILCCVILIPASAVLSQDDPPDSARTDAQPPCDTCHTEITADTMVYVPPPIRTFAADVTNPEDFEENLYQNPTTALFKSLLLPGWGQLGNRRYVKATVIIGLEAWFIGSAIHYGRQASDAREIFESTPLDNIAARNNWYDYLDNKRKNRNKFAWFAGITIFLSMFDAYVDAHLSGSPMDRRDELERPVSFDIAPDEDGVKATLCYSFW